MQKMQINNKSETADYFLLQTQSFLGLITRPTPDSGINWPEIGNGPKTRPPIGQDPYVDSSEPADGGDSQRVEDGRADDGSDAHVWFREERRYHVHEKLWTRCRHRHERGCGYVLKYTKPM